MSQPLAPTDDRRRWRWMFAGALLALLWPFPYHEALNNPNENVRFYMTTALVEAGTYCIDEPWRRWGWVNDAALLHGHHYSVKAPLTSWLGVPGLWLYERLRAVAGWDYHRGAALWACRASGSILPFALFLAAFAAWLRRRGLPAVVAEATWWSLAVGSLLYGYALIFVSHTLAAVGVGGALLALDRRWRPGLAAGAPGALVLSPRRTAAAGCLAACATAADYHAVIATAALVAAGLVVARSWKARAALLAGAALPTLAVMHFQWRAFGDPLRPGHLYLENRSFAAIHQQGMYGANHFHADAAQLLLFDEGFGLFPLTPLWLASLLGLALLLQRRPRLLPQPLALVTVAIAIGGWLTASYLEAWRGGWTIGPRYLAPFVPAFALAAAEALAAMHARFPRATEGFSIGALAVSLLASGWPSALFPHLPEAFSRPLPQFFAPAWQADLAPPSIGTALGVSGVAGMAPLLALAVAILAALISRDSWPRLAMPWQRKILLAGPIWSMRLAIAAATALVLGTPLWAEPPGSDADALERERSHIARAWAPAGSDAATRLLAQPAATRSPRQVLAAAAGAFAFGRDDAAEALLAELPPCDGDRVRRAAGRAAQRAECEAGRATRPPSP